MIDKTNAETKAIKGARRFFADALREHSLLGAFENATPATIDALIEACVTGFQESLKSYVLNDEIPF